MTILKLLIGCYGGGIGIALLRGFRRHREPITPRQRRIFLGGGFVFYILDALGLGSFAPTMAAFKLTKVVDDERMLGTMDVCATLPTMLEALLFLKVVEVDTLTLISMYVAGVLGAFAGGRVAVRLPVRPLRIAMGTALTLTGIMMLMSKFGLMPLGGEATGLTGGKLVIGCAGSFIFAALLPLGIGNYAPTMVLVYLLGMHPAAAFPIMMGLGFFGLASSSVPYLRAERLHYHGALLYTLAALAAVVIAVYLIGSLPLGLLQWLVIAVVFYTAVILFVQAFGRGSRAHGESAAR